MPWGAAVGGAIALYGQDQARSSANKAADKAAADAKFTPYNVYSGYGSGTFSGNTATASLNPQYANLRDQFMNQANSQLGAFSNYDPNQAANDIYGKLSALSAPAEQQARNDNENRLFGQGMLGSTGGGIQTKALLDSQGQSRIQRELQSYTTAQNTLDSMQNRAISGTNAASGLDALALQNLNLGGVFGGRQSAASQFGANLQNNAALRSSDASAQFWSGIGQQVAPAVNSYMNNGSNGYNPFAASQYSSSTGYDSMGGGGSFNYAGQG